MRVEGPAVRGWRVLPIVLALLVLGTAQRAGALDVRLAWKPPADAAGYRVYLRQDGAAYASPRDLGALRPDADGVVRAVVSGLADVSTSYLVVTSYTASGVESALSNELSSRNAVAAPSPSATAAPSPRPTAAPTPTPSPKPGTTPMPAASPSSGSLVLPLDAWTVLSGNGTWTSAWSAELASPTVRTTSAEPTPADYVIAYPGTADLAASRRSLTFAVRGSGRAIVQAVIRTTTGRRRILAYATVTGSATKRSSTATYPIGAGDGTTFRTVTRDLAADVRLAWGETFAAVDQVRLAGTVEVGGVVLGSSASAPLLASGLAIPLEGWQVREGSMIENETDAELDAAVLHVEPSNPEIRPMTIYPAPSAGMLIAPYGRLLLSIRAGAGFALDVRVQTGARKSYRLRYEPDAEPRAGGSSATLPLIVVPDGASSWATVELDLAADLAAAKPGAQLGGVQQIRVRGGFRAASVVADAPLAGAGGTASGEADAEAEE